MLSGPINLLLYYVGFGYVLCLSWVAVMSDAMKPEPPRWTRRATVVLQVIGIAHPAAAVAAWDLRRELERNRGDLRPARGGFPIVMAVSLVIAVAVITVTIAA